MSVSMSALLFAFLQIVHVCFDFYDCQLAVSFTKSLLKCVSQNKD